MSKANKYSCDKIAQGLTAQEEAKASIQYIDSIFDESMAGVIVIDAKGNIGAAHTTPKLAFAWVDGDGEIQAGVKSEFRLTFSIAARTVPTSFLHQ